MACWCLISYTFITVISVDKRNISHFVSCTCQKEFFHANSFFYCRLYFSTPSHFYLHFRFCWLECEVCICHFTIFTISIFFSLLHLPPLFTCYFITIDLFNGVGVFHLFFLHFIFCYFISFLFFFFSHFVNGFVIVYILCFDLWNGLLFQTDFHFYHLRKILLDFSSHFWAGTNIFEQRYNYMWSRNFIFLKNVLHRVVLMQNLKSHFHLSQNATHSNDTLISG